MEPAEGANERLISLCRQVGADTYLSGPAAKAYLNEAQFNDAGITVEWLNYAGYPVYPQLFGTFVHEVSIIDLVLNTGADAHRFIQPTQARAH